jgi:hypothetical protein
MRQHPIFSGSGGPGYLLPTLRPGRCSGAKPPRLAGKGREALPGGLGDCFPGRLRFALAEEEGQAYWLRVKLSSELVDLLEIT